MEQAWARDRKLGPISGFSKKGLGLENPSKRVTKLGELIFKAQSQAR